MRINMLGYGVAVLAALLVSACGTREPENISEDQLNHFTGITEHDHPSSPTADQQSGDSSAASKVGGSLLLACPKPKGFGQGRRDRPQPSLTGL